MSKERYGTRSACVPEVKEIRELILRKAQE
jgi:hypothetical protein